MLVPLLPLSNIEITDYFNYESSFNGVFARNNFPRIKDAAYVINLDDKKFKGTHRVSLFNLQNTDAYFDSFWTEYILRQVLKKIKDKLVAHNIFRIKEWLCYVWTLLYRFHGICAC